MELPETCDSIESPVSLAEPQHLWFTLQLGDSPLWSWILLDGGHYMTGIGMAGEEWSALFKSLLLSCSALSVSSPEKRMQHGADPASG